MPISRPWRNSAPVESLARSSTIPPTQTSCSRPSGRRNSSWWSPSSSSTTTTSQSTKTPWSQRFMACTKWSSTARNIKCRRNFTSVSWTTSSAHRSRSTTGMISKVVLKEGWQSSLKVKKGTTQWPSKTIISWRKRRSSWWGERTNGSCLILYRRTLSFSRSARSSTILCWLAFTSESTINCRLRMRRLTAVLRVSRLMGKEQQGNLPTRGASASSWTTRRASSRQTRSFMSRLRAAWGA